MRQSRATRVISVPVAGKCFIFLQKDVRLVMATTKDIKVKRHVVPVVGPGREHVVVVMAAARRNAEVAGGEERLNARNAKETVR